MNQIEKIFHNRQDLDALALVHSLPFLNQIEQERSSPIFWDGLSRTNWWESLFSSLYPMTYHRLKRSMSRRANASLLFSQIRLDQAPENIWRSCLLLLNESDRIDRKVGTRSPPDSFFAIQQADEFGVDSVHFLVNGNLGILQFNRVKIYQILGLEPVMRPIQIWSVPFQQGAAVVLFENIETRERELIWVVPGEDAKYWAINHNNSAEDPEDFSVPPTLRGDSTLTSLPIISSTEGRTDIPTAKIAMISIILRQRDHLLFDQAKQDRPVRRHWRHLLTGEIQEISVTSSCFLLDEFLLFASNDGILRAHPRINPHSMYHIQDMHSLVPHLVALFNVVALIHSYDTLEVWAVEKQLHDPFLQFRSLYRARAVDVMHAPLLYGPYVIYATLDGSWWRTKYDSELPETELIKVPFKTGWKIIKIKNANWRFWTMVLKSVTTGKIEEILLFAGSETPFLN